MPNEQTYAENKGVHNSYDILDKYEAGLVLHGYEVKAVLAGKISLRGAYVTVKSGGSGGATGRSSAKAQLVGATISPYQENNVPESYNPKRARTLLLGRAELRALVGLSQQKGLTLVPLSVYNKNSKIKLEFAVGKGLKKHDQREKLKTKEFKRRKQQLDGRRR